MTLKYTHYANKAHHFATDERIALGYVRPTITNTRFRVRQRRPEFIDIGVTVSTFYVQSKRATSVVDTASLLPADALKLAACLCPAMWTLINDLGALTGVVNDKVAMLQMEALALVRATGDVAFDPRAGD